MIPRLTVAGIHKAFSGVDVLRGIDLDVQPGEVVALLGENGAGKSTLAAIIAGSMPPSSGTMCFEGRAYAPNSPRAAIDAGIGLIQQDPRLLPDLTIAENVFVGRQPIRAGRVDRPFMRARTQELLRRLGLDVSPDRLVRTLSVAAQQQVEIAKALTRNVRLMIMDEPTAPLGDAETNHLFEQIARLKAEGVSLVYITHRLDEIARLANRIIVLRDGACVARHSSGDVPVSVLLRDMVGRTVDRLFPVADPPRTHEVLRVDKLTSATDAFRDIEFSVRAGEIFGIAGIVGAGRTELVRAIMAADALASGRVLIDGKAQHLASPSDAIRAGIVLVPEDRKRQGLISQHNVAENLALGNFDQFTWRGWFRRKAQLGFAQNLVMQLGIKCRVGQQVQHLSGGNQQKVLIARWVARTPRVFILDEPTRGIDGGARAEIYRQIVDLARSGMAVVIVSSDLEEVLGLSHRILVMARGRQMGVRDVAGTDAVEVMALAAG